MNYLIRNASVVNEGSVFLADVLIRDGIISRIKKQDSAHLPTNHGYSGTGRIVAAENCQDAGLQVIEAEGKYLIPGIIDEHVHFREPGMTQKADIYTESRAAVAGGVTSFMDMPNTVPQTTSIKLLEEKFDLAAQKSLANCSFYLGATNDNLSEIQRIDTRNVCGIKLFMGSSTGNMLVSSGNALERLFSEAPCLIAAHCEDEATIKRNTEIYKDMATRGEITPNASIHPLIRSSEACLRSSARAVALAEKTGARLHILHISTEAELALFRSDIPLENKRITAETCPHYLLLDDSRYDDLGFAIKCNPAIKSGRDRQALLSAVRTGLIDTIGTDHAPHLREEKCTGDCFTAKSGFPSIGHSLELMCSCSGLSIEEIVRLCCHNPATLYGIERRGFIREGYHADLVLVDPQASGRISAEGEYSKCGWSPYEGFEIKNKVTHTFVNGNLVFENGIFNENYRGERLTFSR